MSVGARVRSRPAQAAASPARWWAFRRPCAAHAVRRARRRAAAAAAPWWTPRDRRAIRPAERWLGRVVNAMGEPIDGRGRCRRARRLLRSATAPPPAHARRRVRRAARSRRARAQHIPHVLPRPAHGHLRRLRRRQIGAAVDARAQRGGRYFGDRPRRRTRPRGAGVHRRTISARTVWRARVVVVSTSDEPAADAPPGGLSDAGDRRIFPRPGQRRAGA